MSFPLPPNMRLATPDDAAELTKLVNEAYRELADLGLNFTGTYQDKKITLERMLDAEVYLLYRDRDLIASISISIQQDGESALRCLYVHQLAVHPDHKRKGIGTYLLELAERRAHHDAIARIQLDTAIPALHLVKLYESLGYKPIKQVQWEGKTYQSYVMEKTLGIVMSILSFVVMSLSAIPAWSQVEEFKDVDGCFVLHDLKASKDIFRYGDHRCAERMPACSTFKVPLALMALDKGVLKDETEEIKWDGVQREIKAWNQNHTAASWMRDSVVWYSQALTPKLGRDVIEGYLKSFGFGTHDLSGGIKNAWLTMTPSADSKINTTLKLSPDEQVSFLAKLFRAQLPVSKHAIETTKKMLFLEKFANGFELRGKTGSGFVALTPHPIRVGWFVAHISRGDQELIAVTMFTDQRKNPPYAYGGPHAKDITKSILVERGLWSK